MKTKVGQKERKRMRGGLIEHILHTSLEGEQALVETDDNEGVTSILFWAALLCADAA